MDNNRKQEIQNQIAELQREWIALGAHTQIEVVCDGVTHVDFVDSLSDEDIIEALMGHCSIDNFADKDVAVTNGDLGYYQVFHVTKVVSYNITPF
jgi:hypothetical protein